MGARKKSIHKEEEMMVIVFSMIFKYKYKMYYFHQLSGAENIPHGKFLAIKTLEGRKTSSAKSELIFSTAE